MTYDRSKAFELEDDGLLLNGVAHVVGGSSEPSFLSPSEFTLYFQSNGTLWYHKGTGFIWKKASINFSINFVNTEIDIPEGQEMLASSVEITVNGSLVVGVDCKVTIVEA